MRLCKANNYLAGDRAITDIESAIPEINFKVHKFTLREKPNDIRNIAIFPIFSEFGCETISSIYCLPRLLQKYFMGKYSIVMGWFGRAYLYRHLVDEFWEMPEEHMWLREYCRAFHHVSKNLKRAEKKAKDYGQLVDISYLGNAAVFPNLQVCPKSECGGEIIKVEMGHQRCKKCNSVFGEPGFFSNIVDSKNCAVWLPKPSSEKIEKVKKYLPPNAVGITARKRKTWGRNLDSIFYERLIYLLEDLGYSPVWIGEKITSLSCPFKRTVDFSITEDSSDLETTLALVSQMKFTIQFWTASSRLAAMMGVPYILFESPDQIWGSGQEGMRLNMITRGDRKLVVCHYKNVCNDNTAALNLVKNAVEQIEDGNYEDIIGLVEDREYVKHWKASNGSRIGE